MPFVLDVLVAACRQEAHLVAAGAESSGKAEAVLVRTTSHVHELVDEDDSHGELVGRSDYLYGDPA